MKTVIACATAALLLVAATGPVPAQADTTSAAAAAKKKPPRHHVRRVRPGRSEHVACTAFGCHPLPPGCHPEQGYDIWGNPSAFDAVVCR